MHYSAKGMMILTFVEINEQIYLFNILVYTPSHTHTQKTKENILFLSIPFCLTYSFSDKLVNVHIKLNHSMLLNTFLWCLLNDHFFSLLSEWEHYMSYMKPTQSSYISN